MLKLFFVALAAGLVYYNLPQQKVEKYDPNSTAIVLFNKSAFDAGDMAGEIKDMIVSVTEFIQNPDMDSGMDLLDKSGAAILTASLMTGCLPGAIVGGAMVLVASIFGPSEEDELANFRDNLLKKMDTIIDNQEALMVTLDDLKNGQSKIMKVVKKEAAKKSLEIDYNTYKWLGPHGMTQIAANYQVFLREYRNVTIWVKEMNESNGAINNTAKIQSGKLAASFIADRFWTDDYLRVQNYGNIINLMQEIIAIKGDEEHINRWLAAQVFNQYLALRVQSLFLELQAQSYRDTIAADDGVFQINKQAELAIMQMALVDINGVDSWAKNDTLGFTYKKSNDITKNCNGRYASDLGWYEWEIEQCIDRYPKRHNRYQRLCCEMFNFQETGKENWADLVGYDQEWWKTHYWDKITERSQPYCDIDYYYVSNYTHDCIPYSRADYFWYKNLGQTSWGDDYYDKAPLGYLMCGFQVRYASVINVGDRIGMYGMTAKWCRKSNWRDQKWGKVLKDKYGLEDEYIPGRNTRNYDCPYGTYFIDMTTWGLSNQGSDDDPGMIKIGGHCRPLDYSEYNGYWPYHAGPSDIDYYKYSAGYGKYGYFIDKFGVRIEQKQGYKNKYKSFDHTGINQIHFRLRHQLPPQYYDKYGWRYDPNEFIPQKLVEAAYPGA